MLDRARANPKIKFLTNTVVEDIYDVRKDHVTGVKLRNLKTGEVWDQDVDGFFVAIGHIPNTKPLRGAARSRPGRLHHLARRRAHQHRRACSTRATCRTASTARPSRPPAPAAWPPSKRSGSSKPKVTDEVH